MWLLFVAAGVTTLGCNRPLSQFLVSQEELSAPANIEFINQSEKAEFFTWDFGDGHQSTAINPKHRYVQSGKYRVVLSASNGKRSRTSEHILTVGAPEEPLIEIQTNYGNMLVKLYDETPKHKANFMKLAEAHFYDSLLFHRVIQGFMIQGGDPTSRAEERGQQLGAGGPGYQIDAEIDPALVHTKGVLSAARTGDAVNPEKKSSGSQFYIVQGSPVDESQLKMLERRKGIAYTDDQKKMYQEQGGTPFLDMEYTVFGEVIKGRGVIDKIAAQETDAVDRPVEDIRMKMIIIK